MIVALHLLGLIVLSVKESTRLSAWPIRMVAFVVVKVVKKNEGLPSADY